MLDKKKIAAFICECNPFHEGHKRLIKATKEKADIVIAVMSGDFVQRGEPAVYDKYRRTKDLIKNGVDLVIELPVEYTLSSAKYFATSGLAILKKLKFVDYLFFGSVINDIDKLTIFSDINVKMEKSDKIKPLLRSGMSYPKAVSKLYDTNLSSNDILAVEYINAIKKLNANIIPICVKRKNDLPSATNLRKNIKKKVDNDNLSNILNFKLGQAVCGILDLSDIYCMSDDLYNSILKSAHQNISFSKRAKLLKTKNRTLANIKRILLNIIFNIKKQDVETESFSTFPKYIRILGIKKSFLPYLKYIKIPYLLSYAPSSYKTYIKNFPKSKEIRLNKKGEYILSPSMLKNIFVSDFYNIISKNKLKESNTKTIIL